MTYVEAKQKLHNYIDQADENKVMNILSLFEGVPEDNSIIYDEDTLNMLRERSEEYRSGKSETFSLEESLARINSLRKKNAL